MKSYRMILIYLQEIIRFIGYSSGRESFYSTKTLLKNNLTMVQIAPCNKLLLPITMQCGDLQLWEVYSNHTQHRSVENYKK